MIASDFENGLIPILGRWLIHWEHSLVTLGTNNLTFRLIFFNNSEIDLAPCCCVSFDMGETLNFP